MQALDLDGHPLPAQFDPFSRFAGLSSEVVLEVDLKPLAGLPLTPLGKGFRFARLFSLIRRCFPVGLLRIITQWGRRVPLPARASVAMARVI